MTGAWPTRRLDELADVGAGNPAPQDDASFLDGTVPFFRTSDVGRVHLGELHDAEDRLNEVGAKGMRLHPAGTVLLPKSGASTFTDHRVITTKPGYVSSHLATIRANPNNAVDRYLYYVLQTISARDVAGDSSYPTLSLAQVKAIEIPAAPLPAQRRIVAILDEAFEGIAAAIHNAQRNVRSAFQLSSQALSAEFTRAASAAGTVTLRQLCSFENGDRGENYPNKSARVAEGIPFINAGHLSDRRVNMSGMDYISRERFSLLRSGKPMDRDVLFCLRGSLGKFGIVDGIGDCAIASSLVIVRPNTSTLSEYIAAYFESGICADMIETYRSGTAQPNLGAKQLAGFRIPALSEAGQAELVERTTVVSRECRELVEVYEKKLALLAELKQSLLARAFCGELTREPIAA